MPYVFYPPNPKDANDDVQQRLRKLEMGKSMSSEEQVILLGGQENKNNQVNNQVKNLIVEELYEQFKH